MEKVKNDTNEQISSQIPAIWRFRRVYGDFRMDNSEWCRCDEQLLTLLAKVRDEEEVSMGTDTNNAFYKNFAARLSADLAVPISDDDVADRVRHHRVVFKSYRANPAKFQHTHIGSSEYGQLLIRCFGIEKKNIRVPRNLGSRQSRSFDSTSSVARTAAAVATDPKITLEDELARVLSHLHSQHGLDANRLTLFSSFCERKQLVSRVFLNLEGHAKRLSFISDLNLSGYTSKFICFLSPSYGITCLCDLNYICILLECN
uniref:Uncharacterized protein n=2 Tax=Helianthus annuus TaxID=4232 RepID=A0A251TJS5_HELAN